MSYFQEKQSLHLVENGMQMNENDTNGNITTQSRPMDRANTQHKINFPHSWNSINKSKKKKMRIIFSIKKHINFKQWPKNLKNDGSAMIKRQKTIVVTYDRCPDNKISVFSFEYDKIRFQPKIFLKSQSAKEWPKKAHTGMGGMQIQVRSIL